MKNFKAYSSTKMDGRQLDTTIVWGPSVLLIQGHFHLDLMKVSLEDVEKELDNLKLWIQEAHTQHRTHVGLENKQDEDAIKNIKLDLKF